MPIWNTRQIKKSSKQGMTDVVPKSNSLLGNDDDDDGTRSIDSWTPSLIDPNRATFSVPKHSNTSRKFRRRLVRNLRQAASKSRPVSNPNISSPTYIGTGLKYSHEITTGHNRVSARARRRFNVRSLDSVISSQEFPSESAHVAPYKRLRKMLQESPEFAQKASSFDSVSSTKSISLSKESVAEDEISRPQISKTKYEEPKVTKTALKLLDMITEVTQVSSNHPASDIKQVTSNEAAKNQTDTRVTYVNEAFSKDPENDTGMDIRYTSSSSSKIPQPKVLSPETPVKNSIESDIEIMSQNFKFKMPKNLHTTERPSTEDMEFVLAEASTFHFSI